MADAIDANANAIDANAIDANANVIDANANVIDATENDIADAVPAINFNLSNDADHATLNFFSNPMYLSMIKEKLTNTKTDKNKPDVKFYRKRLIALFKDLLKDEQEPPTQELKQMYTRFVGTAINHFEIMDNRKRYYTGSVYTRSAYTRSAYTGSAYTGSRPLIRRGRFTGYRKYYYRQSE